MHGGARPLSDCAAGLPVQHFAAEIDAPLELYATHEHLLTVCRLTFIPPVVRRIVLARNRSVPLAQL